MRPKRKRIGVAWKLQTIRNATGLAASKKQTDRCVKILERYPVPVGNSAAGEMACEWTIAAQELRD